MKLRITGFLAVVVPVPDVVLDVDDPLEEPEALLLPLLPELLEVLLELEVLLDPLLEALDPLPPDDPLEEVLEDDPDFELPLLDLLLLLLFDGVVV